MFLCFMSMIENNDITLKCTLKQIQIPCNLLLLFKSARETPVKRLKAIATQRKLPRSLQFKRDCSVEFWQNFVVDIIEFQVLKGSSMFILVEGNGSLTMTRIYLLLT